MTTAHTATPAAQEAIENADAHLNNAALPTYSELRSQNDDLVKALTAAIPFIGYDMSVEDIKTRCYAALENAGAPYGGKAGAA